MASRAKASKSSPGDKGANSTRPSRLRIMRPEVEEVLRSPRRGRPKQKHQGEDDDDGVALARYDCGFQDEGDGREFAPPELVWCKVRSHPWWPAQVFDAADASELALQHVRPGASLVAYFWDKTFAWSDASALLPFRSNFTRLAGQSTVFNFVSAVDSALQEVGRRVEAGLTCACFATSIVKKQEIENSGIREGAYGAVVDDAYMRDMFSGKPFLDYISALGKDPLAGTGPLDFATAKAQLRSFNRSRGQRDLPEFVIYQGIEDVAEAIPHTKRKRMDKSGGDDVPSNEKKSRHGESSSRKREAPSEPAKKEAMDENSPMPSRGATNDTFRRERKLKNTKCSTRKKKDTSKDADETEVLPDPAKKEAIVQDSSMPSRGLTDDTLIKERKSKTGKSSAKKKKGTSKDTDKRDALPEPAKEDAMDEDNSMPSRRSADDTLSKERKSKISKSSARKTKKGTSKDADKLKALLESANKEGTDGDSSMHSGDAAVDTLSKERRSKIGNSARKKKKDTSKDADGLEAVGGSKMPAKKSVDDVLSDSKSGRRLRSTHKIEEALEGLKELGKDGGGGTIKVEDKDAALLKDTNPVHRASSARKKDKITEDGDGLADGRAQDSVSPGKKRLGRCENSASKNVPISISEHGRKKKKLSELMTETGSPNPAPGGKSKARGKSSLHASSERLEDLDRDMKDTMETRKRKKLDMLGDLSLQAQPVSSKKSTKVGDLANKAAGQKSHASPVVKSDGGASQTRSRRPKNTQVTVSDDSPHTTKLNSGRKDPLTESSLSCREMLSQLCLAAHDLKKIGKIRSASVKFFTDFRKSSGASNTDTEEVIPEKATNTEYHASSSHADEDIPEKATNAEANTKEPSLADHMKDDYWADILINVEEPLSSLRKKKDKGKSSTSKTEQNSKNGKQQSNVDTKVSMVNGAPLNAEDMENPLLAGLVLHFSKPGAVLSRSDLIKIFSQYGPVKEAKTEVANNANCAQVIFKRRMDAETAFGGVGKMTALGPALVSFRLSDFPLSASNSDVEEEIPEKAANTDYYASSSRADEATNTEANPSEAALADHMKDDYWADILINVEEPLSSLRKKKDKGESRRSKKEHHAEELAKGSSVCLGNSEEARGECNQDSENGKQQPDVETQASITNGAPLNDEKTENPLLAGLVLHFSTPGAVPSCSDLIKILGHYGPVEEAKTEVANGINCAQVIFKRRKDAEAAFGGAGKMSALGPGLVSFRISDFPSSVSGNKEAQQEE